VADGQITLDQLISSSSSAVLRALQEHQRQAPGTALVHPRIWVGYWIDLAHGVEPVAGGVAGPGARQ
jgi:hypothetical protein